MSKTSYKELRARVPPNPLSPLKEIREKQEILFGLSTPPSASPLPEPEETDVFSTPQSVFTLVEITEVPIDDLALPPPAIPSFALDDIIEINKQEAQLAENDGILKSQYAAIEYYHEQLEYYANALNYNKSIIDAQLKKCSELSEQIMAKQEQLNSLNAQINATMTAQLLTAFMAPPPIMAYN